MPTVAFRVVRSRRTFVNYPVVRKVLADAMDNEVKPRFLKRFEGVVANWDHKPKFEIQYPMRPQHLAQTGIKPSLAILFLKRVNGLAFQISVRVVSLIFPAT